MIKKSASLMLVVIFAISCSAKPSIESASVTSILPTDIIEPTFTFTPMPTDTPLPTNTPTLTPIPATETPTPGPSIVFHDDFEGSLGEGWSWVREDNRRWSLTKAPGFLRLTVQSGSFGDTQPPKNVLLREPPSGSFIIETYLKFKPFSNFQFAGLVLYWDDQNVIQFGRAYCGTQTSCVGNGLYLDNIVNRVYSPPNFSINIQQEDQVYLRLQRTGSDYTGYYSEDGVNWTSIGQVTRSGNPAKVGLMAGQAYTKTSEADFDYFTVIQLP